MRLKSRFLAFGIVLAGLAVVVSAETSPRDWVQQADAAYEASDWTGCLELYRKAISAGMEGASTPYNGACCAALAKEPGEAFRLLGEALDRGYRQGDHLTQDADLKSLHKDSRWSAAVDRVKQNEVEYRSSIHGELLGLFQADQRDRASYGADTDWAKVGKRDDERRARVLELIEIEGELKAAVDFFHAAMVLQHGNVPEDFKKAHELAKKAAELDPTMRSAKWLSAAAWDRYLVRTDRPQVYGTQFHRPDADSLWTQEPFDRDAVTDAERQELGVPTLAQSEERLESMNAKLKAKAEAQEATDDS